MTLAVVGIEFPNEDGVPRRFEIAMCQPGESIELRPEPKNPVDPRAIGVYSLRGIRIGFLTAERAPLIGGLIGNGHETVAIFQAPTSWGAYVRVAFDGQIPTLPPQIAHDVAVEDGDEDSGFYPDEEWPD